jgi:uncharacterized protein
MFRFIVIIVVFYVFYRAIKGWMAGPSQQQVRSAGRMPLKADDVMIKDPQCGIYFARRDAVVAQEESQTLYFCSETCKEKYQAEKKS